MVHYGHTNQADSTTTEDKRVNLEDHSVVDFFRSITFKDAIALFSIAAFVFGLGIYWNSHFGEVSRNLKLSVQKLESDITKRDERINVLEVQLRSTASDKNDATTKLAEIRNSILSYRQCLSSILVSIERNVENERVTLVKAANTYGNKAIREQVLTEWESGIKAITSQEIKTVLVSLQGEGGTCRLNL